MVCGYCEGPEEEVKKIDGVAVVLKDYEERHGTDRLYILLLVATWVIITILGALGKKDGNVDMLLNPYNTDGKSCGIDKLEDFPKFVYVRASPIPLGNCVKECPKFSADTTPAPLATSVAINDYECLPVIKAYSSDATGFSNYLRSNCCVGGTPGFPCSIANYAFESNPTIASKAVPTCYCALKKSSTSYFNRCVDDLNGTVNTENPNSKDYMKMLMADVVTSRAVIFGFGFVIALIFAFLYTYLMSMNCCATIIVWSCIFAVFALGVAIVSYGQNLAAKWDKEDPQVHSDAQKRGLVVFNILFMIAGGIAFFIMIWCCGAINMAISCVCLGAKALDEMPMMICIPMLQITGFILFMIPWVFYSLFIASVGDLKFTEINNIPSGLPSPTTFSVKYGDWQVDGNANVGAKIGFMFFTLFWTMNFIANLGSLVIAHAVSCWYFTKPEDRAEKIGNGTLVDSYKLVFRYHLGTIAFGSFLIATIQFIRAIAIYIESTMKERKQLMGTWYMKIVCCCMHLCLCLLEKCMKFISKNAYIQTAIYGSDFCKGARDGFHLVFSNIRRIGAITVVSSLCLTIGKVFVVFFATGSSYIFLNMQYGDELYSLIGPTIIVAIIAWMAGTMFMDVLGMTIDTIFICFIADESSNNGVAAFADDDFKAFVDNNGSKKDDEEDSSCCGGKDVPENGAEMTNTK
jgi:hypothetical protein